MATSISSRGRNLSLDIPSEGNPVRRRSRTRIDYDPNNPTYDSQPLISVKDLKKFFEKASASRNANENFNNNNRLSSRHESISNLRVKTDQAQNIENDIRELSHTFRVAELREKFSSPVAPIIDIDFDDKVLVRRSTFSGRRSTGRMRREPLTHSHTDRSRNSYGSEIPTPPSPRSARASRVQSRAQSFFSIDEVKYQDLEKRMTPMTDAVSKSIESMVKNKHFFPEVGNIEDVINTLTSSGSGLSSGFITMQKTSSDKTSSSELSENVSNLGEFIPHIQDDVSLTSTNSSNHSLDDANGGIVGIGNNSPREKMVRNIFKALTIDTSIDQPVDPVQALEATSASTDSKHSPLIDAPLTSSDAASGPILLSDSSSPLDLKKKLSKNVITVRLVEPSKTSSTTQAAPTPRSWAYKAAMASDSINEFHPQMLNTIVRTDSNSPLKSRNSSWIDRLSGLERPTFIERPAEDLSPENARQLQEELQLFNRLSSFEVSSMISVKELKKRFEKEKKKQPKKFRKDDLQKRHFKMMEFHDLNVTEKKNKSSYVAQLREKYSAQSSSPKKENRASRKHLLPITNEEIELAEETLLNTAVNSGKSNQINDSLPSDMLAWNREWIRSKAALESSHPSTNLRVDTSSPDMTAMRSRTDSEFTVTSSRTSYLSRYGSTPKMVDQDHDIMHIRKRNRLITEDNTTRSEEKDFYAYDINHTSFQIDLITNHKKRNLLKSLLYRHRHHKNHIRRLKTLNVSGTPVTTSDQDDTTTTKSNNEVHSSIEGDDIISPMAKILKECGMFTNGSASEDSLDFLPTIDSDIADSDDSENPIRKRVEVANKPNAEKRAPNHYIKPPTYDATKATKQLTSSTSDYYVAKSRSKHRSYSDLNSDLDYQQPTLLQRRSSNMKNLSISCMDLNSLDASGASTRSSKTITIGSLLSPKAKEPLKKTQSAFMAAMASDSINELHPHTLMKTFSEFTSSPRGSLTTGNDNLNGLGERRSNQIAEDLQLFNQLQRKNSRTISVQDLRKRFEKSTNEAKDSERILDKRVEDKFMTNSKTLQWSEIIHDERPISRQSSLERVRADLSHSDRVATIREKFEGKNKGIHASITSPFSDISSDVNLGLDSHNEIVNRLISKSDSSSDSALSCSPRNSGAIHSLNRSSTLSSLYSNPDTVLSDDFDLNSVRSSFDREPYEDLANIRDSKSLKYFLDSYVNDDESVGCSLMDNPLTEYNAEHTDNQVGKRDSLLRSSAGSNAILRPEFRMNAILHAEEEFINAADDLISFDQLYSFSSAISPKVDDHVNELIGKKRKRYRPRVTPDERFEAATEENELLKQQTSEENSVNEGNETTDEDELFSPTELLALKLMFSLFDRSGKNYISYDDLVAYAEETGDYSSIRDAALALEIVDIDGDGKIGLFDFIHFASRLKKAYKQRQESEDQE